MTLPQFTPEEQVAALVRRGVPKDKAERSVLGESVTPIAPLAEPVVLVLPWSALVSDNRKYAAASSPTQGARVVMKAEYRAAKDRIGKYARTLMDGRAPMVGPVSLHARVWVPDNRPGHDVANFCKIVHDSLQKIVYRNDDQLHLVTWQRSGVDVDRPRAELTIGPL